MRRIVQNEGTIKYAKELRKLATDFDLPFEVIGAIAINESNCDPLVAPYRERTWKYFTDRQGKPLNLFGSKEMVQRRALEMLGEKEFEFQIHAHGAFQVVGSVLRENGYPHDEFTKDFYQQGVWSMKHLSKMRDRFVVKYKKQPLNGQLYAMYNGGFGAVNEEWYEEYVAQYVLKAEANERKV